MGSFGMAGETKQAVPHSAGASLLHVNLARVPVVDDRVELGDPNLPMRTFSCSVYSSPSIPVVVWWGPGLATGPRGSGRGTLPAQQGGARGSERSMPPHD